MKTKEQVLEERGWEKMIGYCFDACRAEDEMKTFVEQHEVEAVVKDGPQTYWSNDSLEQLYDLDDAWEQLYDYDYDPENKDETIEEWERRVLQ